MLTALLVYFAATIVFYLYSFAQFEYMMDALKTKPEPLPMPPGEYRRIRLLVLTAAAEFYTGFFLLLTCGHLIATLD